MFVVSCEKHVKYTYTVWGKLRIVLMLRRVVHMVTTVL